MKLPFDIDRPLVFFDLETTGLNVSKDRIVELALIRFHPDDEVDERVRRFNPGIPIPPEASGVHGITDKDVENEARFAASARSLSQLLDGCDLAGFNVRQFDLPMLTAEFKRTNVPFEARERRIIDVKQIFHREEPRDLTAAASFYLERNHTEAHSALGDVQTTAEVLSAQMQRYDSLPRNLDGLHGYCDAVAPYRTELERWFQERDGVLYFYRGKHSGRSLPDVAAAAPDYLRWMMGADDMDAEVVEVARNALAEARR